MPRRLVHPLLVQDLCWRLVLQRRLRAGRGHLRRPAPGSGWWEPVERRSAETSPGNSARGLPGLFLMLQVQSQTSHVRSCSGKQLAAERRHQLGVPFVCNLQGYILKRAHLWIIVQTESNLHFSPFLSSYILFSLSLQGVFICCVSDMAEQRSAEEALLG